MISKTFLLIFLLIVSLNADDEASEQIWANLVIGSMLRDDIHIELDFEPKVQISGEEKWANIDITQLVEYFPNKWIDLTGEVVLGYTVQTDSIRSYELTPRLGIRFHILGNIRQYLPSYKYLHFNRFNLSSLFRYEYRSLWYNNKVSEHQSRFRARLESKIALTHSSLDNNNMYYLTADIEGFFDIGEKVEELYSNKARLRLGTGYRYDKTNTFELLMIYDFARNTIDGDARNDAYGINLRYKIFY